MNGNDQGWWRKIPEFARFLSRAGPRLGPRFALLTLRALFVFAFAWIAYIHITTSAAHLTLGEVQIFLSVLGAAAVIVAAPVDVAVSIIKFWRVLDDLWQIFFNDQRKRRGHGPSESTKSAKEPTSKPVKRTKSASAKKLNASQAPLPRRKPVVSSTASAAPSRQGARTPPRRRH